MHLAYQALFPFAVLVGAAGLSSLPDLRQRVGAIAPAATGIGALSALVLLLELKPSERVDLVYLRAFPGADLALRLDGLSLAFAAVLLASATGLMLARLGATGDRRNPWRRWLLAAAAALGGVLAGNLLLTYIALQVLTLAWSGAVNETAPRTRTLRLVQQAGDLALLIAADGFKRAGATDGAELMKAIRAANIAEHIMIGGPITFDTKGQNNNIPSAMIQNRSRTPTVVMPAENATMAPVFPMPPWQGRT